MERDFLLGIVARLKGDALAARAAFMKARTQLEEELRVHPDDMDLLSDLGLIDAALGRKARGAERRPARDGTGAHRPRSNVRAVVQ